MITLKCTSCKRDLHIDDAFAGGVCRCTFCGTIQTVPLSKGPVAPRPVKALYRGAPRSDATAAPSSGLEQLGEVVTSSGLASGRLRKKPAVAEHAGAERRGRRGVLMYVGGGVVLLILGVAAVVWPVMQRPEAPGGNGPGGAGASAPVAVNPLTVPATVPQVSAKTDVSFLGLPLGERRVVFLIDRGKASAEAFSSVAAALHKTLEKLPAGASFQVILWDDPSGVQPEVAFPKDGLGPASRENLAALRKVLDEATPVGQSAITKSLNRALAARPEAVVIVTGKSWLIDEEFVKTVQAAHGDSSAKLHTISIGPESAELRNIADKTGGLYRRVTESELADHAQ